VFPEYFTDIVRALRRVPVPTARHKKNKAQKDQAAGKMVFPPSHHVLKRPFPPELSMEINLASELPEKHNSVSYTKILQLMQFSSPVLCFLDTPGRIPYSLK
jgi:hypothetical protein